MVGARLFYHRSEDSDKNNLASPVICENRDLPCIFKVEARRSERAA